MALKAKLLERDIEKYAVKVAKKHGCLMRKVKWINVWGAPDRVVFYRGRTYWVEFKKPGGRLTANQVREHARMKEHKVYVDVIDSKEGVDLFFGITTTI